MANIKIYIANLGKYNEGYLVGEWIDLPATEEEFEELFVRIKVGYYNEDGEYVAGYAEGYSFYEEVAIHDYETEISGLEIGEYDNIQKLNELAEELERADLKVIEAIIEATGYGLAEALESEDNAIFYEGHTLASFAREVIQECYNLPEEILDYIDYKRYAQSYYAYSDYYEVDNGVIFIG